jgi:hypothetical protein
VAGKLVASKAAASIKVIEFVFMRTPRVDTIFWGLSLFNVTVSR